MEVANDNRPGDAVSIPSQTSQNDMFIAINRLIITPPYLFSAPSYLQLRTVSLNSPQHQPCAHRCGEPVSTLLIIAGAASVAYLTGVGQRKFPL